MISLNDESVGHIIELIFEEMAKMRIEFGLVLKYVNGGEEKVNVVNYFSEPPPSIDEYYNEKDSYVVNERRGVSNQTPKAPIKRIGAKVKDINVGTMVITTERVIMS